MNRCRLRLAVALVIAAPNCADMGGSNCPDTMVSPMAKTG
jgi:hypothetical protein